MAVLGGGNGAHATAGDLAKRGFEVALYSVIPGELDAVKKAGGVIMVEGGNESLASPVEVPETLGAAVSGAEVIAIVVPSTAHSPMAEAVGPILEKGQHVLLNPGHTGGALEFRKKLDDLGVNTEIILGESMTLTYFARLVAPGKVDILLRTRNVLFSSLPSSRNADSLKVFSRVFPNLTRASSVLETGLSNINAVMHPAGTLLNTGWIEHTKGGFLFYTEGVTPAICKVIERLDAERRQVAKGFGLEAPPFSEIFYNIGSTSVKDGTVFESIKGSEPNKLLRAPNTLDSRYVHEDVGHGLVGMTTFARIAGVKTPILDSLINIACKVNDVNYWQTGRTATRLGIEGMDKDRLLHFVEKGTT